MDETLEKRLKAVENQLALLVNKRIGKTQIIPGSLQQLHMAALTGVIVFGLAANRPTSGNNYVLVYFATDTNVLSIWNNSAWKSTTLT